MQAPIRLDITGLAYVDGHAGSAFVGVSIALGTAPAWLAFHLLRRRTAHAARRMFLGSVLYLPLLLGMMVVDKGNPISF